MTAAITNLHVLRKTLIKLTIQQSDIHIVQQICQGCSHFSTVPHRVRYFNSLSIWTDLNSLGKPCKLNRPLTHTNVPCHQNGMSNKFLSYSTWRSSLAHKLVPELNKVHMTGISRHSQALYSTKTNEESGHSQAFYGTKSDGKKTEMTEDEKLLFKAIQSESESLPFDDLAVDPQHTNTAKINKSGTSENKVTAIKKKNKKKSEKFKEKMVENLNFPNVTVYGIGRLDLASLQREFENDELYVVCQLPPEFRKEALMIRSKSKNQDDTYTEAFFFRSFGVACWAMNQHQGEKLVMKSMKSKQGTRFGNVFKSFQDVIDNREVFRTVQSESIKRLKDRLHLPSVTDASLANDKVAMDLALKKYTFSKALLQSVTLGLFEEMLDDFIENRGLKQRTEELKLGIGSAMNSNSVYTGFGEISYIRYQANLSDLFDEEADEYWEYDDLEILYADMVTYLSIPKRIRELNRNLDYCQDLIKLFNDRLTDKHHVVLERIIIVLIFIEILIELIRIAAPYVVPSLLGVVGTSRDSQETSQNKDT